MDSVCFLIQTVIAMHHVGLPMSKFPGPPGMYCPSWLEPKLFSATRPTRHSASTNKVPYGPSKQKHLPPRSYIMGSQITALARVGRSAQCSSSTVPNCPDNVEFGSKYATRTQSTTAHAGTGAREQCPHLGRWPRVLPCDAWKPGREK